MIMNLNAKKMAFISSFQPRKCGIATFCSDLVENIGKTGGIEFSPSVIAVQGGREHRYTKPVEFVIRRDFAADYTDAADFINRGKFDAVSVQHEFGLFGSEAGSYINLLLRRLRVPIVTTLHTVLERPSSEYFNALVDVCEKSNKVIVMNKRGIDMLKNIYGVPARKIRLIPHGIPDIPFGEPGLRERITNSSRRKIILTFGLLGRNKGIEVMLKAMPAIIKAHPEILYIVLGTTHPEVIKHEGYSYRDELHRIAKDLELGKNVIFHDRFVTDIELQEFLYAADIYVTPYLHKEQLTSGTLAFAVGAGKAVVSTPYWAAEELLADERGKLVPFGDPGQLAVAIKQLLDDESLLTRMQLNAYQYGRAITWENVGRKYWDLFEKEIRSVSESMPAIRKTNDRTVTRLNYKGVMID